MRLIDANSAKKALECTLVGDAAALAQRVIDRMPTIDAVPVVRCRDCKWFNADIMECECDDVATDCEGGASFSINFGPDDFCSYGERKGGDGNG